MTIKDAEPGDVYADAGGKLWRILEVIREPTVVAEEVEGTLSDPNSPPIPTAAQQISLLSMPPWGMLKSSIVKTTIRQPADSALWFGFHRIFRRVLQKADQP